MYLTVLVIWCVYVCVWMCLFRMTFIVIIFQVYALVKSQYVFCYCLLLIEKEAEVQNEKKKQTK